MKHWFVVALLCMLMLSACATATSTDQTTPTTSSTTPTITHAPTPTATSKPTSNGPAILGATLDDFKAKYGPLNSHSNPAQHEYYFALYGNDKNDLTLLFNYNTHTDAIILDAPENHYWNESDAVSHCLTFLPSDAKYQRQMNVRSGDPNVPDIQRVYLVPSLANVFPASAWNDENRNQTTAGTVGMILNHWTSNGTITYLSCVVQVGLQNQ